MFVLSCVGSGLGTGLPTAYKIHHFRINSVWEQAQSIKVEEEEEEEDLKFSWQWL
jgi:hypothetical protein